MNLPFLSVLIMFTFSLCLSSASELCSDYHKVSTDSPSVSNDIWSGAPFSFEGCVLTDGGCEAVITNSATGTQCVADIEVKAPYCGSHTDQRGNIICSINGWTEQTLTVAGIEFTMNPLSPKPTLEDIEANSLSQGMRVIAVKAQNGTLVPNSYVSPSVFSITNAYPPCSLILTSENETKVESSVYGDMHSCKSCDPAQEGSCLRSFVTGPGFVVPFAEASVSQKEIAYSFSGYTKDGVLVKVENRGQFKQQEVKRSKEKWWETIIWWAGVLIISSTVLCILNALYLVKTGTSALVNAALWVANAIMWAFALPSILGMFVYIGITTLLGKIKSLIMGHGPAKLTCPRHPKPVSGCETCPSPPEAKMCPQSVAEVQAYAQSRKFIWGMGSTSLAFTIVTLLLVGKISADCIDLECDAGYKCVRCPNDRSYSVKSATGWTRIDNGQGKALDEDAHYTTDGSPLTGVIYPTVLCAETYLPSMQHCNHDYCGGAAGIWNTRCAVSTKNVNTESASGYGVTTVVTLPGESSSHVPGIFTSMAGPYLRTKVNGSTNPCGTWVTVGNGTSVKLNCANIDISPALVLQDKDGITRSYIASSIPGSATKVGLSGINAVLKRLSKKVPRSDTQTANCTSESTSCYPFLDANIQVPEEGTTQRSVINFEAIDTDVGVLIGQQALKRKTKVKAILPNCSIAARGTQLCQGVTEWAWKGSTNLCSSGDCLDSPSVLAEFGVDVKSIIDFYKTGVAADVSGSLPYQSAKVTGTWCDRGTPGKITQGDTVCDEGVITQVSQGPFACPSLSLDTIWCKEVRDYLRTAAKAMTAGAPPQSSAIIEEHMTGLHTKGTVDIKFPSSSAMTENSCKWTSLELSTIIKYNEALMIVSGVAGNPQGTAVMHCYGSATQSIIFNCSGNSLFKIKAWDKNSTCVTSYKGGYKRLAFGSPPAWSQDTHDIGKMNDSTAVLPPITAEPAGPPSFGDPHLSGAEKVLEFGRRLFSFLASDKCAHAWMTGLSGGIGCSILGTFYDLIWWAIVAGLIVGVTYLGYFLWKRGSNGKKSN